jgi:hypothetical protein
MRSVSPLRIVTVAAVVTGLLLAGSAHAQLDKLLKGLGSGQGTLGAGLPDAKIDAGLKEALQVATEKTVSLTGKTDGYFANQAIKILMPERLRSFESGLRTVGYGPQIDELVLGMNRAAEGAAPQAKQIFSNAIGAMTFDDARKILNGGDTAATQYFKDKTTPQLTTAFRPVVERSMNQVGVSRQYRIWSHASRRSRSPRARPSIWTATSWTRGCPASSRCWASRRSRSAPTPPPAPPIC